MNLIGYKEKKEELIRNLKNIGAEFKDSETSEFIEEKIAALKEDKFIVSIFGSFSNGKSSFLNALMGFKEPILVVDEKASTATITRIMYPKDETLLNKGEIVFRSGRRQVVELKEIKKYCARNEEIHVENDIKEVILYLDAEILKNGVEIVDTPGFNSIHSIHTEIAKDYIENSNASIFLFDYSKPGGQTEFKFLGEVNDKMDKIFLVLNKIDLENRTENTLDRTIDALRRNIEIAGANIRNKEVHPISARLELEALTKNENDKYFESFREKLESYLVSEENTKDRIESPIKKIIYKLSEDKKIEEETMAMMTLEKKDLSEKIKNKEERIEEKEKDLKTRKVSMKRLVDEAIAESRKGMEKEKDKIIESMKEELQDYNTKFSLKICKFKDMAEDTEKKTRKAIEKEIEEALERIKSIIEENIDEENEVAKDLKRRVYENIQLNLKFRDENYESDNEELLDMTELNGKIEKLKEEIDDTKDEYYKSSNDRFENDKMLGELNSIESELKDLKKEKETKIRSIGTGRLNTEKYSEFEERRGCGGFFNWFLGEKEVTKERYDYSEIERCEGLRKEAESEYEIKSDEEKKRLKQVKEGIKDEALLKVEEEDRREEYINKKNELRETRRKIEAEKIAREDEYITMKKRDYIRQITNAVEEVVFINKKEIQDKKDFIKDIAIGALSSLEDEINKEKDIIRMLGGASGKSKEELNLTIKEKSSKVVKLDECIAKLEKR